MTVEVIFFAAAREVTGCDALNVQLPDPSTVADLQQMLTVRFPGLLPLLPGSSWSVDRQFVSLDHSLHPDAEVGLILPVSGG